MFKLTKKELNEQYRYIICAGYCELQCLLKDQRIIGYGSGLYGWNWSAYEIQASNGEIVCVCTGYRDMTGKRIKDIKKFEEKAKLIANKEDYKKRERAEKRNAKAFADYVIKNWNKKEIE